MGPPVVPMNPNVSGIAAIANLMGYTVVERMHRIHVGQSKNVQSE